MPPLSDLGRRIVICGPSNAGKSTLARALSRKLGVEPIYLDQLHHMPGTDYRPRPPEEFLRLHDAAIAENGWVMEGNYFALIPQRLARATGIILLGSEPWRGLVRYVRRTLFEPVGAGRLDGGIDRLNWDMVRFIVIEQPKKRQRDSKILADSGLPMITLDSMRALNALCAAWNLSR